ncbi:Fur family transcriptional regulator [Aliiroseovarius sp. PTFE2010]|uniref:Fur family transcriptional regulator n=1 Tax=Aliiroseovarius sp. PTFE2010 TaxID=3417190 RepID=UPI003CEAE5F8
MTRAAFPRTASHPGARYEASGSEHHDHFVNVETDEVIEFRCHEIEVLQQKIADENGFEIGGHRLEIYVRPKNRN